MHSINSGVSNAELSSLNMQSGASKMAPTSFGLAFGGQSITVATPYSGQSSMSSSVASTSVAQVPHGIGGQRNPADCRVVLKI